MKKLLSKVYSISSNINGLIALSRFCHYRVPLVGKVLSFIIDRAMMTIFGIDLRSFSVNVRSLSIAHPVGVMLGGNGVYSEGQSSPHYSRQLTKPFRRWVLTFRRVLMN